MKAQWAHWAAKIDALSLRERGILFFAVIAVLLAVLDTALLTPTQNQFKSVQQKYASQGAEINRLRGELLAAGKPVDQNQEARDRLAEIERDIAAIDRDILAQAAGAGSGRALEPVLVQFLRRQPNLTLLGTQTVTNEGGSGASKVPGLTRQGLELRVAGPYLDLMRYVQGLEQALPYLRWSSVQIKAEKQPPELTLQVYVLGAAP